MLQSAWTYDALCGFLYPQVEYMTRIIRKWAKDNNVKL